MHKENEYMEDGKLFVKRIRKCICKEKTGGRYSLVCSIFERGEQTYDLSEDGESLKRGERTFWLTEDAKKTVNDAVSYFEQDIKDFLSKEHVTSVITSTGSTVSYIENLIFRYDLLLCLKCPEGENIKFMKNRTFDEMMSTIRWECHDRKESDPVFQKILESKEDTIAENPLYAAAKASGDEKLMKRLKLYYNIATPKDCTFLGKLLGAKVLPKLPEAYDKNYVVDANTIHMKILDDSCYTILHRPYFAMMGSTHSKWQLNPHTRRGVDAAKAAGESISFKEFLDLFREAGEEIN